jgi:hypothetical protein
MRGAIPPPSTTSSWRGAQLSTGTPLPFTFSYFVISSFRLLCVIQYPATAVSKRISAVSTHLICSSVTAQHPESYKGICMVITL